MSFESMINRAVWLHIRQNPELMEKMEKAVGYGPVAMFDVLYPEMGEGSVEEMFTDLCMTVLDMEGLRAKLQDRGTGKRGTKTTVTKQGRFTDHNGETSV